MSSLGFFNELATVGIVTRRDDAFDDKYPAFLTHGSATFCENLRTALIVTVVEGALHDVGITALGHRLEEISGFERAALGNALRRHVPVLLGAR
jgi:hypothetical protein